MDVTDDEARFTELLLHVAELLRGERAGGATKLNKVLFFVEFTHLRRHGAAISGCEFQKLVHGPSPRQLLPVRRRLLAEGAAELTNEDFLGRPQQRLVPKRDADASIFYADELDTINDVLDQLAGLRRRRSASSPMRNPAGSSRSSARPSRRRQRSWAFPRSPRRPASGSPVRSPNGTALVTPA